MSFFVVDIKSGSAKLDAQRGLVKVPIKFEIKR